MPFVSPSLSTVEASTLWRRTAWISLCEEEIAEKQVRPYFGEAGLRELIKQVWEADPMICPDCQREMRIVSLIDEREVIEKMLKCLGLWQQGVRVDPQRQTGNDPPGGDWVYEPIDQDPFPDYDTEPVLFYANA